MLKMVILDDEKMERKYMKKYIDWNSMGIEIVGEAANGVDGLEVCLNVKPDIILTDVKMPEMDGLEFSKKVKEFLPDVKIIFISGHDDFSYARSAVDLNAFGYILKPFRIENVIEVVRKVTTKCDEELKKDTERSKLKKILDENKGLLKDSLIRELLNGIGSYERIWERIDYLGINVIRGWYCTLLIEVDEFDDITNNMQIEEKQFFSINLLNSIQRGVAGSNAENIKVSDKHYSILLSFNFVEEEITITQRVYAIAEAVKANLLEDLNISVTIGMSKLSNDIGSIIYLNEQAKDALKCKLFNLKGQLISFNDTLIIGEKKEIDFKRLDNLIVDSLKSSNVERLHNMMDEVFDGLLANRDVNSSNMQSICISIMCSAIRFLNEINCTFGDVFGDESIVWNKLMKFETIADIKQWVKNILDAIIDYVNLKKKSKNRMIVEKVLEIMKDRFGDELTTKELSKEIFLSPNYIGAIFKEEMGTGLLEHLTRIRMEKAEEMLRDPRLKIYEIALKVGYSNTPYFSTVFRDFTGLTPSEYRDKL